MSVPPFPSIYTNPDNLVINRQGKVAPAQRLTLPSGLSLVFWTAFFAFTGCFIPGILFVIFYSFPNHLNLLIPSGGFLLNLGLFFVFNGHAFLTHRRVWREFQAGAVVAGEGEVYWDNNAYHVVCQSCPNSDNLSLELPPGRYRFYYLPKSGHIIGAETLPEPAAVPLVGRRATHTPEPPPPPEVTGRMAVKNILTEVLKWEANDVTANQAGRLSEAQRNRLRRSAITYSIGASVTALISVNLFLSAGLSTLPRDIAPLLFNSIIGLVALMITSSVAWKAGQWWRDVQPGNVLTHSGFVDKSQEYENRTTVYYFHLDHQKHFRVSHAAYAALIPGYYRLYSTPYSNTLLGIEPIGSTQ